MMCPKNGDASPCASGYYRQAATIRGDQHMNDSLLKLNASLIRAEASVSRMESRLTGVMSLSPAFTRQTLWLALLVFLFSLCINMSGIWLH